MRFLIPLLLIFSLAHAADEHAADAPGQAVAAAAKPLPDSVEPELAKQAFKALDDMRAAIDECGKKGLAHWSKADGPMPESVARESKASADFRRLQRECLTEFFASPERRKPLPASEGKDAREFTDSIDGDWTDPKSNLPQRAGFAYGHAKKIEWLTELCDGAPHRYGNKNRDELDAERKARENAPAPKAKKKP